MKVGSPIGQIGMNVSITTGFTSKKEKTSVPPVFVTAVRAKVRYKVNHFVVSVLFNNKIYAPHPETQTTKTDHFPAFNKLFRLPEMYLLPTVEIRIS